MKKKMLIILILTFISVPVTSNTQVVPDYISPLLIVHTSNNDRIQINAALVDKEHGLFIANAYFLRHGNAKALFVDNYLYPIKQKPEWTDLYTNLAIFQLDVDSLPNLPDPMPLVNNDAPLHAPIEVKGYIIEDIGNNIMTFNGAVIKSTIIDKFTKFDQWYMELDPANYQITCKELDGAIVTTENGNVIGMLDVHGDYVVYKFYQGPPFVTHISIIKEFVEKVRSDIKKSPLP